MSLDSKSLPLIAGLVVLGAAGAFVLMKSSSAPQTASGERTAVPAVALHAKQIKAREAIHEGRLDDAGDLLRSVPKDDPAYVLALGDLGILYEQTGDPVSALATANELLDYLPEDSNGHFIACRAKYMIGDYAVAEFACMRAIEIDPRNMLARYSVALTRLAQGKVDQAIDSYLRAMDIDSDETRVRDALNDLTALAEKKPDMAAVHYALAFFANSLGDRDKEKAELERYLELEPAGPVADTARERLAEIPD